MGKYDQLPGDILKTGGLGDHFMMVQRVAVLKLHLWAWGNTGGGGGWLVVVSLKVCR